MFIYKNKKKLKLTLRKLQNKNLTLKKLLKNIRYKINKNLTLKKSQNSNLKK